MSAEALPIEPASFAHSIESLPLDVLHAKAAEITNSIAHINSSNEQMLPFADDGDQDCKDALFENLLVLNRMQERIGLLRAEVEKRGMRWADAEDEEAAAAVRDGHLANGHVADAPDRSADVDNTPAEDGDEAGVHL